MASVLKLITYFKNTCIHYANVMNKSLINLKLSPPKLIRILLLRYLHTVNTRFVTATEKQRCFLIEYIILSNWKSFLKSKFYSLTCISKSIFHKFGNIILRIDSTFKIKRHKKCKLKEFSRLRFNSFEFIDTLAGFARQRACVPFFCESTLKIF